MATTVDFRFLENNEGVPGEEITAVGTGEQLFVEVLASADIPDGIVSLSFDLDFDEAVLSSLDGGVLNAEGSIPVDESIITSTFDFQRNGSLDEGNGEIFLGAGAVGNSIGDDGNLEQFALLGFEAAGAIEAVTPTTLDFTVPSENPLGGAAQGNGDAITADNTTLEDPVLQINPPPIVFVEVRLFENDGGSLGEEITDDTVAQGQTFFAEILVSADIPSGIVSFSFDLDFDEAVLSSLDGDVLNAEGSIPVDESIITSTFDFQRNGSLDEENGEIFLGAGAVGNSIGDDGNLEQFALLQFEATGVAPDGTPLDITVPSTSPQGGAALGDGRAIADVGVDIEEQSVTIPDNQPPAFEVDPEQSIDENTTLVVEAVASDPDGDVLTFSISGGADEGLFDIDENGNLSFNEAPDFENPQDEGADNLYEVQVSVEDDKGGTVSQDFEVTVNDVNEAPELDEDPFEFTINEFVPAVDSDAIVQVEVVLRENNNGTPGDELSASDLAAGETFFAEILASADIPEGIVSFSFDLDFDETVLNSLDGDVLNADDEIAVDNSIITSEFDLFRNGSLDEGNGEIFLGAGAVGNSIGDDGNIEQFALLQFEATEDITQENSNILELSVPSDDPEGGGALGDGRGLVDVDLFVEQQELPPAEELGNGSVVGTVTATDPDADDSLTFALDDTSVFDIDSDGNIFIVDVNALDFEVQDSFQLEVTATDAGDLSDTATVNINLNNVNEAPVADEDARSTDEDTVLTVDAANGVLANDTDPDEGDTLTVSAVEGGTVGERFDLASGASVTLNADGSYIFDPNGAFENLAVGESQDVTFTYTVSDEGGLTDEATVTLTVDGVNDAPEIIAPAPFEFNLPEPLGGASLVVGTIEAEDIDEGDDLTFSISGGDDENFFTINENTGELSFNEAPDFEAPADNNGDNIYEVEVTVDDDNGGTDVDTLLVTVENDPTDDNEPPVFDKAPAQAIDENTTLVVEAVASDSDGDDLTFDISGGADGGFFTIDENGNLSFNEAPDFENPEDEGADNLYEVQVSVEDGEETVTQVFEVTVNDVNEAPVFDTDPEQSIDENETEVVTVEASDPDGDDLTFDISGGADGGFFTIDENTGELSFNEAPDFENPQDANSDNVYEVSVTADDGNGGTTTEALEITVEDVNETPVITSDNNVEFRENLTEVVTTVTAEDPEDDVISFALAGGDDRSRFAIDPSTGDLRFITAPDFENPLDADGDNFYEVEVEAEDAEGNIGTQDLTVEVTDQQLSGDPNEAKVLNIDSSEPLIHTLTGNTDSLVEIGLVLLQPGQTTADALQTGAEVRTVFSVFPDTFGNGEPGTFEDLGQIQRVLSVVGLNRVGYVLNEGNNRTIDEILAQNTGNLAEALELGNFNRTQQGNTLTLEAGGVTFEVSETGVGQSFGANLQGQQNLEVYDLQQNVNGTQLTANDTVNATLSFDLISVAAFDNAIGFYTVDGKDGAIGGVNPGEEGYFDALLSNVVTNENDDGEEEDIILRGGANVDETSADFEFSLEGGQIVVPFIISRGGNLEALPDSVDELPLRSDIYTPFIGANSDGVDHFRLLADNTFGIEDLRGGGDQDFNDIIFQLDFTV